MPKTVPLSLSYSFLTFSLPFYPFLNLFLSSKHPDSPLPLLTSSECVTYEAELQSRPDFTHKTVYQASILPPGFLIQSVKVDNKRPRSFYWSVYSTITRFLFTALFRRHGKLFLLQFPYVCVNKILPP